MEANHLSRPDQRPPRPGPAARLFRLLGPGLISGAADDDPSAIATYSIAGAQFGTQLLWTALVTWPMMAAVQIMCARIGMATGEGLARGLQKKFPRWVCLGLVGGLLIANTINIGADLAGMADAAQLLTGANSHLLVVFFGVVIAFSTVRFRYRLLTQLLQWLGLSLGAYIITAFLARPDWKQVWHDVFLPSWPRDNSTWEMLVAILGTTISPYLFFWQTAQEVEEEKLRGRDGLRRRRRPSKLSALHRRVDVGFGSFCSNLVMFFVILTCAGTLHRYGLTTIASTEETSAALRPLAGPFYSILYTLALLGVGCVAIPTLAGSSAYAFAETFRWKHSLNEQFEGARGFYIVLVASIVIGVLINLCNFSPIRTLYWAAIINGMLSPFLLIGIFLVATDGKVMRHHPSSWFSRGTVLLTILVTVGACVALIFEWNTR